MIKTIVAVVLITLGGVYYFLFHPPVVLKRATKEMLATFEAAVDTKTSIAIERALTAMLTEDAQVRLEVQFFSITQQNAPAVVQDFNKPQFIAFIDNTLYPLSDYDYYPVLQSFELADDKQSAQVTFTSKEWGDGKNYYGGTSIEMRFSSDTECQGTVLFADKKPLLKQAVCKVSFRAVPKPSEIGKMQGNMDVMKDYLTKP
jgi:hypothetical protein